MHVEEWLWESEVIICSTEILNSFLLTIEAKPIVVIFLNNFIQLFCRREINYIRICVLFFYKRNLLSSGHIWSFTLNIIPVNMFSFWLSRHRIFHRTQYFTSSFLPPHCLEQMYAFYLFRKKNTFLSARKPLKNVFRCTVHSPDIQQFWRQSSFPELSAFYFF